MLTESLKNYQQYDFKSDSAYAAYIDKFYPTPTGHLLELKKRKYYREKVDKEFDVDYDNLKEYVS